MVIGLPPLDGALQDTVSWLAEEVTVGAFILAGTVVIFIDEDPAEAAEVPAAFVAVTVKTTSISDPNPSTVSGDEAPVAVWFVLCLLQNPEAVKEVAGVDPAGKENDTEAAPLSNGLFVPTLVALLILGVLGFEADKEPRTAPRIPVISLAPLQKCTTLWCLLLPKLPFHAELFDVHQKAQFQSELESR